MTGGYLSPSQITHLFAALDSKLGARDVPVDLLVVGGAAIAFQWNPDRLTRDIDVIDPLPDDVVAAVAGVAADTEGLSDYWLNDGAMVTRPTGATPREPTVVYAGSSLTVSTAGAPYVLAMKVTAGRDVDRSDLPVLFDAAGVTSLDEVYALQRAAYPGVPLHAAARRLAEKAWTVYAHKRGLAAAPLPPSSRGFEPDP